MGQQKYVMAFGLDKEGAHAHADTDFSLVLVEGSDEVL